MPARYEIWFRSEPGYMASASQKTFKMLLKRAPQNIRAFRKLSPPPTPDDPLPTQAHRLD